MFWWNPIKDFIFNIHSNIQYWHVFLFDTRSVDYMKWGSHRQSATSTETHVPEPSVHSVCDKTQTRMIQLRQTGDWSSIIVHCTQYPLYTRLLWSQKNKFRGRELAANTRASLVDQLGSTGKESPQCKDRTINHMYSTTVVFTRDVKTQPAVE